MAQNLLPAGHSQKMSAKTSTDEIFDSGFESVSLPSTKMMQPTESNTDSLLSDGGYSSGPLSSSTPHLPKQSNDSGLVGSHQFTDSGFISSSHVMTAQQHSSGEQNRNTDSGFASSPLVHISHEKTAQQHSSGEKIKNTESEVIPVLPYLNLFTMLSTLCGQAQTEIIDNVRKYLTIDEWKLANKELWQDVDEDGDFEALNAARESDDIAVVFSAALADRSSKLNQRNSSRQTVLHVAAELCDKRTVRYLITHGADGGITDLWGNTPLHIAAWLGRHEIVTALTTKLTKLEVVHSCFKVPFKSLPQDNKNQFNHDGRAPIHLAVMNNHVQCIPALSQASVDMDIRRLGDGNTPLHIAIENNNYEMCEALLRHGADTESRNHRGESPQQLAFLKGRPNLVELLDQYGASPNQLLHAEPEAVSYSSDEEMDCDDQYEGLSDAVGQMAVAY